MRPRRPRCPIIRPQTRCCSEHAGHHLAVRLLITATGASRRQIHTIAEEIDAALHEHGDKRLSIAGYEASKWVVQDYGDVMVHVFDAPTREYYSLEDLWADAPRVDWQRFA